MEIYTSVLKELKKNPKRFIKESNIFKTAKDKSQEKDRTLIPGIILTIPATRAMREFTASYISATREIPQL